VNLYLKCVKRFGSPTKFPAGRPQFSTTATERRDQFKRHDELKFRARETLKKARTIGPMEDVRARDVHILFADQHRPSTRWSVRAVSARDQCKNGRTGPAGSKQQASPACITRQKLSPSGAQPGNLKRLEDVPCQLERQHCRLRKQVVGALQIVSHEFKTKQRSCTIAGKAQEA